MKKMGLNQQQLGQMGHDITSQQWFGYLDGCQNGLVVW